MGYLKETFPDDSITLSTGIEFYANNLIVGIDDSGEISEGYDGGIETRGWTPEDRRALADMMIARWARFGGTPSCLSWKDVDALEQVYRRVISDMRADPPCEAIERVYDLAARLAARLPPRQP
jgi:hypothetical protein